MPATRNSSFTPARRYSPVRRQLVLGSLLGVAGGASFAAPAVLPSASSLPDELALTLQKGQPLVVMVSLPGCPYCRAVREQSLAPMHQHQGLAIVQVDMQSKQPLKGFDGTMSTHDQVIRAWKVDLAPTLLFFGRKGVEVAERLVGASLPDFYGAYLDERLELARKAVQG